MLSFMTAYEYFQESKAHIHTENGIPREATYFVRPRTRCKYQATCSKAIRNSKVAAATAGYKTQCRSFCDCTGHIHKKWTYWVSCFGEVVCLLVHCIEALGDKNLHHVRKCWDANIKERKDMWNPHHDNVAGLAIVIIDQCKMISKVMKLRIIK